MSGSRQALLVLGMHRSGTSALTGLLGLHGVALGSELSGAAADNQAGFWENSRVVALHERLFAALGTSWDDPRELHHDWLAVACAQGFLDDLVMLLDQEFGTAHLWAVKDPRMCRLLPLWRLALERLKVEPKLLFALRDPGEVAGSLMRRNGLSPATSALLWLHHLAEPVLAAEGLRHCMVDYRELLQDWRGCMTRIGAALDVAWPTASGACADAVHRHLRADLQHQLAAQTRDLLPGEWRDWLVALHDEALATARGERNWAAWETAVRQAQARLAQARPLIADLQPASKLEALQRTLSETGHARDRYRAEAERLFDECAQAHGTVVETEQRWQQLQLAQKTEYERQVQREQQAQRALQGENRALQEQQRALQEQQRALQEQQRALQAGWDADRDVIAGLRQQLVEAQGEIVRRTARIEQVRTELDAIRNSRSWRWTRPLRFVLRTLRNRGLTAEDRRRLGLPGKAAVLPMVVPVASAAISDSGGTENTEAQRPGSPAPQSPRHRDVFVWAVIDWHFRIQRPQHLARELALAGHRVFYVSNHFIDDARPGFSVEPLDGSGRLFQVHLHLAGSPAIYHAAPNDAQREQLRASLGEVLAWTRSRACTSLVQHPYWLETARLLPNQRLVYDCMDHHAGFADNTDAVLAREQELMRSVDLLVVTSDWLLEEARRHNPHSLLIRNACEYGHFCTAPKDVFRDPQGRRVIGYYGAIAEWFDLALLEKMARQHPDCLVLLVGADTAGAQRQLSHLANVQFTGEVPYARLPFYLYAFDVCLLPFQVIPLTLATNPVKVYEYLSAGREVVSVELPELAQFGDLVRTGRDHATFLAELDAALRVPADPALEARRREFAAGQTWAHRTQDLMCGVEAVPQPRVSVVVVTYNNLDFTKVCLESLELHTDYPALEVIVVDNASSDDTPAFLRDWARRGPDRHVVLNADNRGFAAANNQGLKIATGDYLVMLNNDTHVTPGWVATLVRHFRTVPELGMLGPVTNNIGNEARIELGYQGMAQMLVAAADYTARHVGQLTPLRTAAFFCVMMPRHVYAAVGELDEAFGIGMFEDDDYCRRVEQAGWKIACADDVFIHHHLSASFDQIKQERRQQMFEQNRAIYEAKWGPWTPHTYRQ